MAKEQISQIKLGDMVVKYLLDTDWQTVGMTIIPAGMEDMLTDEKHYIINAMVQAKMTGDIYPGAYGNGSTMRNGETTNRLDYRSQEVQELDGRTMITTYLEDIRGYKARHMITWYHGESSFEVKTFFENHSNNTISLEMLSSFSIGGITPFQPGDAHNSLLVHRIRSKWSHEGRLETIPVEDLQLEPPWSYHAYQSERFGQVGSMPVKKYFPFVAVEDTRYDVLWGAQLAHEASWQMELFRHDDCLNLSGGLADREFGHWMKNVEPGEIFETPTAILSVCRGGGIDNISQRLTQAGQKYVNEQPEQEQSLPIVFNEYCTTWGNPSHENIAEIVNAIKGKGFEYFVIDCGWFKEEGVPWDISMGDYNISDALFPNGLNETVNVIRESGMRPGIWFEIDNVGRASKAYEFTDHLLKRDGQVLTTYNRRFWDMNDPWVKDYLTKKVIGLLKDYGFEYMKMDYNDTIGLGCDGSESLGEGLRKNMDASVEFVRQVKDEVPGIILENCASGGHKLEPLMMSVTAMASFSDAHECEEIPIIAANLHRSILPRQSQIWAVIRKTDTLKRIAYSVANTFLGRMCLSGDVTQLEEAQWKVIDQGIAFYKTIAPIIKDGYTHRFGPRITSERHPEGWQGVVRIGSNGEAYVLIHTFNGKLTETIEFELPENCPHNISCIYSDSDVNVNITGRVLQYKTTENMKAVAVYLK